MALPEVALTPPHHGADLAAASRRYGIPLSDWLDLSTGINPCAYPVGPIDPGSFQHLPCDEQPLREAAQAYCGAPVLPVAAAGSQVLIQWLPLVRAQQTGARSRVAVPAIGYSEHAFRWQWAGHELFTYDPRFPESVEKLLARKAIDVLIAINAHNPLGLVTSPEQLLVWHRQLASRGGWLVVDEAFIDPTPQFSVAAHAQREGLIVLRSLGKFFGLAGIRCGFAFANDALAAALQVAVGPWSVSGPALAVAAAALRDRVWQAEMRLRLPGISAANAGLLASQFATPVMRHGLFNSVQLASKTAAAVEDNLARSGIRVRRIELDAAQSLLRFGLIDPADEGPWQRLAVALPTLV